MRLPMRTLPALPFAIGLLVAGSAEAGPDVARCRQLESEFDYKAMVTECSVAAADPGNTREERIELYRLLGFAHTALGDEPTAEVWYLRVLLLDPAHELPPEVSPKFREGFAKAVKVFLRDGKVTVSHAPPTPPERVTRETPLVPVSFEITDKLGRVSSARVEVRALIDGEAGAPATRELRREPAGEPGRYRFFGELPDPARAAGGAAPHSYQLEYQLVLLNSVGDTVAPAPAFGPQTIPLAGEGAGEGLDPLLLVVGAGAVGGVLLAGAAVGVGAYCAAGYCSPKPVARPVGWVNISVATGGAR